jgi:hypothetical protein
VARLKPEGLFDYSILERMKSDDYQPPAGLKQINRIGDKSVKSIKLAVDRNPQSLKSPGGGMNAPMPFLMNCSNDQVCKLSGGLDRRLGPRRDDLARYPPRHPLFTVFKDNLSEFALTKRID